MNEDIRLNTDFIQNRKIKMLRKKLGSDGVLSLITLWLSAARTKSSGKLSDYSIEEVEVDSDWMGEGGVFIAALLDLKLLDALDDGSYAIHNWGTRQCWASRSEIRSGKARFSRLARANTDIYMELKENNIDSITKQEYLSLVGNETTVQDFVNNRSTTVERPYNAPLTSRSTPTPSPSPNPSPSYKKIKKK
jgi:hypothetical protein